MDIPSRVLRAIALQRTPGFNFPGHFLQLAFERVGAETADLSLDTAPWSADRNGQMNLGPLALLADIALASSFRGAVGPGARVATVTMNLQLTGAPRMGRLHATTAFDGFIAARAERQGLAHGEIRHGRELIATMQGSFMAIGKPDATAPHPMPKRGENAEATIDESLLHEPERAVMRHARESLASDGASFIERFWGYLPRATKRGASCKAWNGPHVGNRVGHAQGGFTFGLAATTAMAALPESWSLVGASAWYVGPGIGQWLTARATIVHRGTLTAVVRTRIEDEAKRGVLEVTSSHAR
jgi:acyl-coenzyme A thioesterase PaaI-like protein